MMASRGCARSLSGRSLLLLLGVVVSAGCGASPSFPDSPSLADLRTLAAEYPSDARIQRRYAIAEALMMGSESDLVEPALRRALELEPNDPVLHYLLAHWLDLHGNPSGALQSYLTSLDNSVASVEGHAAATGELSVKALRELEMRAPEWRQTVESRLAPRLDDGFSPVVRIEMARLLGHIALREGNREEASRMASVAGCIQQWRVAGPFGPRALLGFDEEVRPDGEGNALAASYDLGPARGRRSTRDHEAQGCVVHLGQGPVAGSGTTFAAAEFDVEGSDGVLVHLETPNSAELFVDGQSVARIDRRRSAAPRLSFHHLPLAPGSHRLVVKLTTRHPNPVLRVAVTEGPHPSHDEMAGLPPSHGLLAAFLRSSLALGRGDPVEARETLIDGHGSDSDASLLLQLRAAIALADPLRPPDVGRDEGRRLFRMAARRDPRAWVPRFRLAVLDAADGRILESIQRLKELEEEFPEVGSIPLRLADLLLGRGWTGQADQAVARSRALLPKACGPMAAALASAKRRERWPEVEEIARELRDCDARTTELYQLLLRRRRWDAALAELQRIQSLEPRQNRYAYLSGQLEIARARGDEARVAELLSEMADAQPQSVVVAEAQVDRLYASSGQDSLTEFLDRRLLEEPAALAELRLLRRALTGGFALSEFRVDGREALEAFETSGREYEEPQVLVLDYTVVRVFEDGSSLELTHNIWKVQSDEVVDERGEFSPPDGAHFFQLHTIKADGRRIEPDAIEGKDTVSLPQLAPGDYVEYEYVRSRPPPSGFPGGYIGDRFFFRSFEIPYDRSELTMVVPKRMELVLDPRGGVPELETRESGDLRILSWGVQESRPFRPEPSAVPPQEWIPSINVGVGATWPRFVDSLRDALADKDIRDPAAERLSREILGAATHTPQEERSPEEIARILYGWVLEHIEENGDFFGLAPAMLAARTGSRGRVLRYLLELNHIDTDLLAVRSIGADSTESDVADSNVYRELVLRLRLSERTVYLATDRRGVPFGYLPPAVRGQPALAVDPTGERVEIPMGEGRQDRRVVEADIHLRADGGADVEIEEKFYGAPAIRWRNDLEDVAEAMVEQRFEEAYVARLVPGAELTALSIAGRSHSDSALTFRYGFDVGSLGRRQGGEWRVPMLFPSNLAARYAPGASRETPQLVAPETDLEVAVRVHPPSSGTAVGPEPVEVSGPGGASARMVSSQREGVLEVKTQVRLPIMRLPAADYPALAEFCRTVDQMEARELRVALP